ncbi:MAG: DegV family protein, partial [Clostridia bacterium]|nr:DegV family protein [Clostridia bacterium]
MKIAVSVESSVDINADIAKKYDISIIPFHVMLGEDDRVDGEVTPQEIFDYVNKTKVLPKTAALNEEEYKEYFEGLLKNYDAVIHLPISAGISSTYTHAQAAADALKNVYIVDSKSLSTGIALLAIYARKLADSGLDAKVVAEKTALKAEHVQASFVIEKLNYLYKGG